ncbi:ATPase [Amylibacter kogurei]|uniref:ATPase n=1 Tax=Paramylibacter kogurei TaxID=1889778 RepID=A0A2G5K995_9RHOB|nr:division plane positioning ATPase MipZ [Amylibacter kogurei]PIB26116.1 ATPase [Amylibacter kogurei]
MSRILVFGNEKGGAGKSTMAMHVTSALLHSGASVGIMDLDMRQISLKRFFENREAFAASHKVDLPMARIGEIAAFEDITSPGWEKPAFESVLTGLQAQCDYVVVDCPGALTPLSALAHAAADTLITPLNDSYIDFDLLARVDPETNAVKGPSIYSEMVWDARKNRALAGGKPIDWIVARNRLSSLNMHNKRKLGDALTDLSKRIGFRFAAGLSDRVVFRELFPQGLTLLDHKLVSEIPTKMSNVAARQEVRDLVLELKLPDLELAF